MSIWPVGDSRAVIAMRVAGWHHHSGFQPQTPAGSGERKTVTLKIFQIITIRNHELKINEEVPKNGTGAVDFQSVPARKLFIQPRKCFPPGRWCCVFGAVRISWRVDTEQCSGLDCLYPFYEGQVDFHNAKASSPVLRV